MAQLNWGVIGATSLFAGEHMMPAFLDSPSVNLAAVASRSEAAAREVAERFGVPKVYGDYDALLADPDIDVVFNPLPNDMHVPWTAKAARAGKHVLCEKPLALSAAEAETLLAVRDETGVLIQEAYVVRHHPQWRRVREIVASGRIGEVRVIQGWFSYFLDEPENYRSKPEMGGGGLLDVGVYPLVTARDVFGTEPERVSAFIERDPALGVDRLTTCMAAFPQGIATFTCATQLMVHQHMAIQGTKGRIEVPDPFAQSPKRRARIEILGERGIWDDLNLETETLDPVNQYVVQAEAFCAAIRGEAPQEYPLEDSVHMMRALDAITRAAESGRWEPV